MNDFVVIRIKSPSVSLEFLSLSFLLITAVSITWARAATSAKRTLPSFLPAFTRVDPLNTSRTPHMLIPLSITTCRSLRLVN